jgi:hypothetical protein
LSCGGKIVAPRFETFATISAFSGQSNRTRVCPLLDQSGQRWILACDGLSAFDPERTLAVHCGNGFDASFSPYQNTRLSR